MNIEQIKQAFATDGRKVTPGNSDGYYRVSGARKERSLRSLQREAKVLVKQQQKAARRGVS